VTVDPGPLSLASRLDALEAAVRARSPLVPRLALVLGSGLGGLADAIEDPVILPFADLPGWPAASAPGHRGRLLLGHLEGVPVACLQGRLHMYEGLSALQVVEPALLMHRLGAGTLLLTNAAGGVNHAFPAGTLMLLSDHLNLTGRTPLLGPNADDIGPRFTDLTDVWSARLRERLRAAFAAESVEFREGVYAALLGPTYETPAEVRMLRTMGADAVGMSTALEAIAAREAGLEILGLSLVTNLAAGMTGEPLNPEEVLEAGRAAAERMGRLLAQVVPAL